MYGSPLYGIKTGLNEAFVIDGATRNRLMAQDAKSADLLKPFLEGKDLKKWRVEPRDLWLILCPKGWTRAQSGLSDEQQAWQWLQANYTAIAAYLAPFETAAKKRTDKGEFWWELRACAYYERFEESKVVYSRFMDKPLFVLDSNNFYFNNALNLIPKVSFYELGLIISSTSWYFLTYNASLMRGGFYQIHGHVLDKLPIPNASTKQRAEIAALAETCQTTAHARLAAQVAFTRRIPDLASTNQIKLNTKLQQWWLLDFASFRAEILKCFKAEIPLKDRNDWHDLFNQQQTLINTYSQQIQLAEQQLNAAVYALFALNAGEIALIEAL